MSIVITIGNAICYCPQNCIVVVRFFLNILEGIGGGQLGALSGNSVLVAANATGTGLGAVLGRGGIVVVNVVAILMVCQRQSDVGLNILTANATYLLTNACYFAGGGSYDSNVVSRNMICQFENNIILDILTANATYLLTNACYFAGGGNYNGDVLGRSMSSERESNVGLGILTANGTYLLTNACYFAGGGSYNGESRIVAMSFCEPRSCPNMLSS